MLSPMLDIPESTPVWAQCILFSGFSYYKNLYIICFQIYIYSIMQKHWWSLTLSWPTRFRKRFRPPIGFKIKVNTTNNFYEFEMIDMTYYYFNCDI